MSEYIGEERRKENDLRCKIHEDLLKEMKIDVKSILKLINGNGVVGISTMAQLSYNDLIERQKAGRGMKHDIYRWIIFAILSFVAIEVGLK